MKTLLDEIAEKLLETDHESCLKYTDMAKALKLAVEALKHLRRDDVHYHSPDDVTAFMDNALAEINAILTGTEEK